MPELPEVETIKRGLNDLVSGSTLLACTHLTEFCFNDPECLLDKYINSASASKLLAFNRQGKYLIATITNSSIAKLYIVFHLRMTGKVIYTDDISNLPKHTHFYFTLENQDKLRHYLYFNDVRRFGGATCLSEKDLLTYQSLNKLAFDAYTYKASIEQKAMHEDEACAVFCKNIKSHPKTALKTLLLNQSVIAGLGNIYADELLFANQIHPLSLPAYLSDAQIINLFHSIKPLLEKAIGYNGTSFSDYVDSLGRKGQFQLQLKVYTRYKKACFNCQSKIAKLKIAGRSSHFCKKCQVYYGPKLLNCYN